MRLSLRSKLLISSTGLVLAFVTFAAVALSHLVSRHAESQFGQELERARQSTAKFLAVQRRTLRARAHTLAGLMQVREELARGTEQPMLERALALLQSASPASLLVVGTGDGEAARSAASRPALRLQPRFTDDSDASDTLLRVGQDLFLVGLVRLRDLGQDTWLALGEPVDARDALDIAEVTGCRVLLTHTGEMLADSRASGAAADHGSDYEQLRAAVGDAPPDTHVAVRVGDATHMALRLPMHPDGGTLILLRDTAEVAALERDALRWLLLGGLVIAAAGVVVSLQVSRRVVRSLRTLVEATHTMARGDLSPVVDIHTSDEVGHLAESFDSMARRIRRLIHEVRATALRAEEANRAKDRFLASIGHELRTPMTSIKAYAEILMAYGEDAPPAEREEFLQIIHGECERLNSLFDGVLDFVTLANEHGDWHLDQLDLGQLAQDVVRSAQSLQAEKQVEFDLCAEPVRMSGDRARLRQAMVNLVTNAWKFSPVGEAVRVEIARCGDEVEIRVRDRGPGVRGSDAKEAVFAMFYQEGDALTDKPQGTGLGLAIVREIVTMHGGSVECTDNDGGGASFVIKLPLDGRTKPRPIDEFVLAKSRMSGTVAAVGSVGSAPAAS